MPMSLKAFLEFYNKNGEHPVTEIELPDHYTGQNDSPFIILRSGPRTMIINPIAFEDNLTVDAHAFIGGEGATTGVFGMTERPGRVEFPKTSTTSHDWPSAPLVILVLGKQAEA